jgi:hypothetical protein
MSGWVKSGWTVSSSSCPTSGSSCT